MFSIILAYKPDGGIRDKHLAWTFERYKKMFPDAEVIVSQDDPDKYGWDTFSKSKYINLGVKRAKFEKLLITDIDMVHEKTAILEALEVCEKYSFVVPCAKVYKLNKGTTQRVLGEKATQYMPSVDLRKQKTYFRKGKDVNGWTVITKEAFWQAGGYDENFVGWGSEDSAFYCACQIMNEKPMGRISAVAFHLWHEEAKGRHEKRNASYAGEAIHKYIEAQYNKKQMTELIKSRKK